MLPSLLLPVLGATLVVGQHVDLNIPQTDRYVASMLGKFAHYTAYVAPPSVTGLPKTPKPKVVPQAGPQCSYWLEDIKHQGVAAFNPTANYTVFRNVKDYGAFGDGSTDDTDAINSAISDGGRFGPESHRTSTNTLAVVYFPPGTYVISSSIIDYYFTQIIGNPNCMPVIKATADFTGFGLIDGDMYTSTGLGWGGTNTFYRQVRNLIFDMTLIPASSAATGIHWPTAQATSLQNCVFKMSSAKGTQHQGVFIEEGSGGFMTDLTFQGGLYGMNQGNQQFTMRNLTFSGCVTAILQIWDWGWTYKGLNINNCTIGIDMSSLNTGAQAVQAVTLIDSTISNTPLGIKTFHNASSTPPSSGSLIIENLQLSNVPVAVQSSGQTVLAGTSGTKVVAAWAQGHRYGPGGSPTTPNNLLGVNISPNARPASLQGTSGFYQQSKPQYETLPATSFVSVRNQGGKGDGITDDTAAVRRALSVAANAGKVCFFDAGTYKVTGTITVPVGSKIIGEGYSVIMSSGTAFNNMNSPRVVVKVGTAGQSGTVEWSDMIVSTQGPQAGAILIEWNLASASSGYSGMWDVHTRIGGFVGSNLSLANCPTTNTTTVTSANYDRNCVAAYTSIHISDSTTGLYLENNWFWTADHDIDDPNLTQLTIYTGRGMLIDATPGPLWLYGTSVEHHAFYQYQLVGASNIFLGAIQTETAYYQPNPNATVPFPRVAALNDPVFPTAPYTTGTNGVKVPNAEGWGLRVVNSKNILVYGAGLYSFFNNYSNSCSDQGNNSTCQSRILSLEQNSTAYIYDLHTVGTRVMLTQNGSDRIDWSLNQAGFADEVAVFKPQ